MWAQKTLSHETGKATGSRELRFVCVVGYLLKKTRNGKWQKRWFETNGCFLTYYKVMRHFKDIVC